MSEWVWKILLNNIIDKAFETRSTAAMCPILLFVRMLPATRIINCDNNEYVCSSTREKIKYQLLLYCFLSFFHKFSYKHNNLN